MMKNNLKYIYLFGIVLLVQACAVNKDIKVAELSTEKISSQYINTMNTDPYEVISYQDFFKDEILQEHIITVLEKNKDLQSASSLLLGTEALLKATKLNYLPDVQLQLSPSLQKLSKNSMLGEFVENTIYQDYTFAPQLQWEIDLWGRLRQERVESKSLFLSQKETIRGLKLQLIAQTAEVYYNIVHLKDQYTVVDEILASLKKSATIISHQYHYADITIV